MDIIRVAFNTLFISTVFTFLTVLLYSTAGYVLAKFEFKGKGLIFGFIMVSMMIPAQVMYVPLFQLFVSANMTNTFAAVILPSLANAFGVFLMRFKPGKRFGESAHVGQPTGFAQNEHGGIVHVWGLRKGGGAGWSDSPKEVIFSFCIAQRHTPIVRERDVSCESEEIRSAVGFLTERYFCNGLCEAYFQEYQQAKCVIPL